MIKFILSILLFITLLTGNCNSHMDNKVQNNAGGDRTLTLGRDESQIKSAAFSGTNTAWLVTLQGAVLRTTDGGINWETLSNTMVGNFETMSFIDSQSGWAVNSRSDVYQTTNGGQSWNAIAQLKTNGQGVPKPKQILFIDEIHGWLIDTFSVWCTDDGGKAWRRCLSLSDTPQNEVWQPTHALFINSSVGWVTSTNGLIHSTADGGKTWRTQKVGSNRTAFKDIHFLNDRIGWVIGSPDGGIYRSDDGGISWQRQLTGENGINIYSIFFINSSEGWAVGRRLVNDSKVTRKGIILHTLDGGRTWQPVEVEDHAPFFDRVYFADAKHGWLFAPDNIYRTDDGGESWRTALKLSPSN